MREAREVMDQVTAALEAGDRSALSECYAEDAVAITPDAGELKGRAAIADYLLQFSEAFPGNRYEYSAKYDDGNVAIDVGYFTGTNTGPLRVQSGETLEPTGRQVRLRSCDIAQVEGGVVTRHEFFYDQAEILDQLGLSGQ